MISVAIDITGPMQLCTLTERHLAAIRKGAANKITQVVKANFATLGGRYFYHEAAKNTEVQVDAQAAYVTVNKTGVRLRWLGGTVLPGSGTSSKTGAPTKLLSIPDNKDISEAPSNYANLVYIPFLKATGKIRGMLAEGEPYTIRRGKRKGQQGVRPAPNSDPNHQFVAVYWLANRTDHKPNPAVMPSDDAMADAARKAASDYIAKLLPRLGGTPLPSMPTRQPIPRRS